MNLSPKLAAKIAARYSGSIGVYGYSQREIAFREAIQRQGGIFAALSDDARRDFILTLGEKRRKHNREYFNRWGSAPNSDDLAPAFQQAAE